MIENIKNRIIVGKGLIKLFSEWCLLLYFWKMKMCKKFIWEFIRGKKKNIDIDADFPCATYNSCMNEVNYYDNGYSHIFFFMFKIWIVKKGEGKIGCETI